MMTLRDRCLALPYLDRLNLCEALRNSVLQERRGRRRPHPGRVHELLDIMGSILGEPVQMKSRESRYVWARTMVSFRLLQEGCSLSETGRMMGKDHSTIIHMRSKMKDALDYAFAYRDVIDLWNEFQNKIKDGNTIQRRSDEDLVCLGGELPDCDQSTMGEESGQDRTADDS